jgi:hypothetical protein
VGRLKLLRTLSTAAHQCFEQAKATASRRATLVQSVQSQVGARAKEWRSRIVPLANSARDGEPPALSLEGPMDVHRELQLCIKQQAADCAQMQEHEKSLATTFEALGPHLEAAG